MSEIKTCLRKIVLQWGVICEVAASVALAKDKHIEFTFHLARLQQLDTKV
jgi:hypothetical protein